MKVWVWWPGFAGLAGECENEKTKAAVTHKPRNRSRFLVLTFTSRPPLAAARPRPIVPRVVFSSALQAVYAALDSSMLPASAQTCIWRWKVRATAVADITMTKGA